MNFVFYSRQIETKIYKNSFNFLFVNGVDVTNVGLAFKNDSETTCLKTSEIVKSMPRFLRIYIVL